MRVVLLMSLKGGEPQTSLLLLIYINFVWGCFVAFVSIVSLF